MFPNSSLLQNEATGAPAAPAEAPIPLIEPSLRLPLSTSPDGSIANPTIEFARDGRTLNVLQQSDGGFWAHALWHAPTLSAAALLLTLGTLALLLLRAARRQQRFGHYYCPRCNYDLTEPGGMPPTPGPCSECGTDTTRKPARLGRSFTARVWRGALATSGIALCCALILLLTLEPSTAANPWQRVWLEPLTRVGLPRLVRSYEHRSFNKLSAAVWSIPEGRRLATASGAGAAVFGCITKDSKWFVWSSYGGPHGAQVRARDLATNAVRSIQLPTEGPWNIMMVEASPRAGRAIVGYTNSIHRPTNEAVLAEVDPIRGSAEVIGSVNLTTADLSSGGRFVYREVDGDITWAYMVYAAGRSPDGTIRARIITSTRRSIDVSVNGNWWHGPEITADGRFVEVGGGGQGTLDLKRIALADGSQTAIPTLTRNQTRAELADGRAVVLGSGAVAPSVLRLQAQDGSPLAELKSGGSWLGGPAVSADGRWAAAPVGHVHKNWLGEERYRVHVYVWDLSTGR